MCPFPTMGGARSAVTDGTIRLLGVLMRNGGFCYEVLLAVFIIPKRGVGGDAQHTQSMHSHRGDT